MTMPALPLASAASWSDAEQAVNARKDSKSKKRMDLVTNRCDLSIDLTLRRPRRATLLNSFARAV
jgi:hypothetical protein